MFLTQPLSGFLHLSGEGFLFAQNLTLLHHVPFMETIKQLSDIPILGTADIHIWGAEVPKCTSMFQALENVLCKKEQEKAGRFLRDQDRHASIVARGALRILLAAYTGDAPENIEFEYSENGKPFLVPQVIGRKTTNFRLQTDEGQGRRDACATISFNVSHSGDWVVLAFGRDRQVGVDVERIRRDMDVMSIASRYFTAEESALIASADDIHQLFFHHWARKEAYVKATGSGLFRELSSFSVPNEDGEKDGWYFQRLEAGSKYASAIVSDKPISAVPCFDFSQLIFCS